MSFSFSPSGKLNHPARHCLRDLTPSEFWDTAVAGKNFLEKAPAKQRAQGKQATGDSLQE